MRRDRLQLPVFLFARRSADHLRDSAAPCLCKSYALSLSQSRHRFVAGSCTRLTEEFKGGNLWDERKYLSKSQNYRGGPTVTTAARFVLVVVALVVNVILTRLLEMVFPPEVSVPPHYFGVPRKKGGSGGKNLRRTLWRYEDSDVTVLVVFDSKR